MKWAHDDLANDLAAHLREKSGRMIWTDMQLGPVGSPRPDVYSVPFSFSRFQPLAYECKISVSDFRADVTKGKWSDYLRFACAVIFAVPDGLISKADLPPGCGLMVRGEKGWRTVKGPTMRALDNLPQDAWIKLLIDGLPRQMDRLQAKAIDTWQLNQRIRKKFGDEVADVLRDRNYANSQFAHETEKLNKAAADARVVYEKKLSEAVAAAESEAAAIDTIRNELATALGLKPGAHIWQIRDAACAAASALDKDHVIDSLRRQLRNIEQAVQQVTKPVPHIAQEAV